MSKKLLMIGHHDLVTYPRGRILYKALLRKIFVDLSLARKKSDFIWLTFRLLKGDYDKIICTGKLLSIFSRLLTRRELILDAFISNYDTMVHDRKLVDEHSTKARFLRMEDKYACELADKIIVDTEEHKKYFVEEFNIDSSKFYVIPIGADDEIFYPRNYHRLNDSFTVLFFGTFIPLQGVQYIVKAAKILDNENIVFNLIGEGQTFNDAIKLSKKLEAKNINFLGWKSQEEIAQYMSKSDIVLGIFGDTDKAMRVIPNKVYEAIAMRKPLITGDTPSVRRYFKNRENCMLCEVANSDALADSILELKNNKKLADKIADNGYKLFKKEFSIDAISRKCLDTLLS